MLLLEDLRFFIGLFFAIVGALLVIEGSLQLNEVSGLNVNLLAGICYFLFGISALGLAVFKHRKFRKKQ